MNRQELAGIVQDMKPADWSLYYPQGDSSAFWTRAISSGGLQADISEIRAEAQRLDGQPISALTYTLFSIFARTGSRLEYERVYFERRRRLNTYAFLSLLEPDNTGLWRSWRISSGSFAMSTPGVFRPIFPQTLTLLRSAGILTCSPPRRDSL